MFPKLTKTSRGITVQAHPIQNTQRSNTVLRLLRPHSTPAPYLLFIVSITKIIYWA